MGKPAQLSFDLFPIPESSDRRWMTATSTFIHNMPLSVHGWFRFSPGFSAEWARDLIEETRGRRHDIVVLDPFAGVGTAVLAAEEAGVRAYGLEAQPFIARIANTKLLWHTDPDDFSTFAQAALKTARRISAPVPPYPKLIEKCYPKQVLQPLHNLRTAWEKASDGSPSSELTWLALTAILRACSPVGTAPWQYVLPKKSKANSLPPFEAFASRVRRMASDMKSRQKDGTQPSGKVFYSDARECSDIPDGSIDLVITSPPYANNYDYADATRLEMTFFAEVTRWADLHHKARRGLIRSCTQHVSTEGLDLAETLEPLSDSPILPHIVPVCRKLERERLKHGGKKDYHLMVAAYFADMSRVWKALRRICRKGASVCFVVGDSAPYGIYVPVDQWLGELAVSAGFKGYVFEKVRSRNIKWRNRKHRVPLHEGRLWLKG